MMELNRGCLREGFKESAARGRQMRHGRCGAAAKSAMRRRSGAVPFVAALASFKGDGY